MTLAVSLKFAQLIDEKLISIENRFEIENAIVIADEMNSKIQIQICTMYKIRKYVRTQRIYSGAKNRV